MTHSPLWIRRLLVGGVSTLTVGAMGLTGLLTTAGTASATSSFKITQLAGTDRFATAASIATAAFPNGASTVIVASGLDTNLPDSLAASYLAAQQTNTNANAAGAKTGAPILLVNTDSVPAETTAAIATLKPTSIIIVGGTSAVTADVATTLSDGGTVTVTRVAGTNRFLTADAIDSQTGFENVGTTITGSGIKKTAIVADGVNSNLVDALGAAPLSAAGPFPMFLVNGATGTLSTTDLGIMATDGITNAIIVGGTAAVGTQVGTQLTAAGITNVTEAGSDRSATSDVLANYEISKYDFSTTMFNIASGAQADLVDALSGGPLGGQEMAPTLITDSASDAGSVVTFATANESTENSANLFGGSAGVSAATEAAIVAAAQAAPTAASLPPLLSSATVGTPGTSGTTVQYVFNQAVTGDTVTAADFHLYTATDTESNGASATIDGTNLDAVDVVYSGLTTAAGVSAVALATVSSGAVDLPTNTTPAPVLADSPDGAAAIGTTAVAAPTLTTVGIMNTGTSSAPVYEGQYTFSEPVTITTMGGLHLYDPNGTELTCTAASLATTNPTTGPVIVNCTAYDVGSTAATALQISQATLGTADAMAVTGNAHPDSGTNPEGAKGSFTAAS